MKLIKSDKIRTWLGHSFYAYYSTDFYHQFVCDMKSSFFTFFFLLFFPFCTPEECILRFISFNFFFWKKENRDKSNNKYKQSLNHNFFSVFLHRDILLQSSIPFLCPHYYRAVTLQIRLHSKILTDFPFSETFFETWKIEEWKMWKRSISSASEFFVGIKFPRSHFALIHGLSWECNIITVSMVFHHFSVSFHSSSPSSSSSCHSRFSFSFLFANA